MLHCHVPYCRRAGRWPFGEEWFYEAAAETYLPLLDLVDRLEERGVPVRLTVGLTPILLEQMADPYFKDGLEEYMELRADAALADEKRFGYHGKWHLAYLARLYRDAYLRALEAYRHRYGRDLAGAFRRFRESGCLEILGGAATHGYLPLLAQPGSVRLQLEAGVNTYRRYFGRDPEGLWLPECAYRPGLEEWPAHLGTRYFFLDSHAIEGGSPAEDSGASSAMFMDNHPREAAERGPGGEGPARGVAGPGTTFLPYYLAGPGGPGNAGTEGTGAARPDGPGAAGGEPPRRVAVFGRNREASAQVWSRYLGYPGDAAYRECHKRYEHSGLQYWRITGPGVGLGDKEVYDPAEAARRVEAHAAHFTGLVEGLLDGFRRRHGRHGIVVSAYDGELFGHWWFEGPAWLERVLEHLALHPRVELTTPAAFLRSHPPRESITPGESSWGERGNHFTWKGPATEWMWPLIYGAEDRMRSLAERFPAATGVTRRALNQAARELLLLQSSDWGFLITTGQACEYAARRFREHLERFGCLASALEGVGEDIPAAGEDVLAAAGDSFLAYLQELEETDNPFPDIDYRWAIPLTG